MFHQYTHRAYLGFVDDRPKKQQTTMNMCLDRFHVGAVPWDDISIAR
jgi:hypothetical protein